VLLSRHWAGVCATRASTSVGNVTLLNEEEITTALGTLSGWARSGDSITSTMELADFREAMLFTGAVAYLAEVANHHPDILIQWNRVTLTLSTHSEGGLTAADMALAGQISTLR
jgi:4a-hydroxytetrahydrobiopterin dehydratase